MSNDFQLSSYHKLSLTVSIKCMGKETSAIKQQYGDVAAKLVELTDDVVFGDIWERAELSKRDRSLITVASDVRIGCRERSCGLTP